MKTREMVERVSLLRVRVAELERFAAELAADMRRAGGAR